jgi:hypothetical protein
MWEIKQVKKLLQHLPKYIEAKCAVEIITMHGKETEEFNPYIPEYIKEFEKQLEELERGLDT